MVGEWMSSRVQKGFTSSKVCFAILVNLFCVRPCVRTHACMCACVLVHLPWHGHVEDRGGLEYLPLWLSTLLVAFSSISVIILGHGPSLNLKVTLWPVTGWLVSPQVPAASIPRLELQMHATLPVFVCLLNVSTWGLNLSLHVCAVLFPVSHFPKSLFLRFYS